jgi:hypothetical protein
MGNVDMVSRIDMIKERESDLEKFKEFVSSMGDKAPLPPVLEAMQELTLAGQPVTIDNIVKYLEHWSYKGVVTEIALNSDIIGAAKAFHSSSYGVVYSFDKIEKEILKRFFKKEFGDMKAELIRKNIHYIFEWKTIRSSNYGRFKPFAE